MEFNEFAKYFNMMAAIYIIEAIVLYLAFRGIKYIKSKWFK